MHLVRRVLTSLVLTGALTLSAGAGAAWSAPPANDTYDGAAKITLPFTSGIVDTTEATLDQNDSEIGSLCGLTDFFTPSNSVWYTFTATTDAAVLVDAFGSGYPVVGAVVTGAPGSFAYVSCFSDYSVSDVQAGQTYHVVLYGAYGSGGNLQFSLTPGGPPTATVAIARATVTAKTGLATVYGSASCSDGAWGYASGTLSQTVGRFQTIRGDFNADLVCDGIVHKWSATVRPYSGKFGGGSATVDYSYYVYNPFGEASDSGTVLLKLLRR